MAASNVIFQFGNLTVEQPIAKHIKYSIKKLDKMFLSLPLIP